ncbi:translation initiation factor IF-2-like [Penaeus japonicus]|uniref:translation initiation factor IF-2-like n=1 Tax=Penaeus japonicus TaxID=27405 RepID=UPI001C71695B|nr:translation initiation factor IF-2-like [Penaeus japonicus]
MNCLIVSVLACAAVGVSSFPQGTGGVQASPPQAPFAPGLTPEVQQARDNFYAAYNYLAELAHVAPDDPPATPAASAHAPVTAVAPAAPPKAAPAITFPVKKAATTPAPFPPGYQFGGLTPDVALATADFFKEYNAAAARASVAAAV